MTDHTGGAQPHAIPPHAQIMQLSMSVFISQAIYVAASFRHCRSARKRTKSRRYAELAAVTETNEGALYRVLRSLASVGVFAETSERSFINSPMSETLSLHFPIRHAGYGPVHGRRGPIGAFTPA